MLTFFLLSFYDRSFVSRFNVSYPMHLMSNTADHIRTKGTGAVELACDDVKYVTEVDCQPRPLGAFHCLHWRRTSETISMSVAPLERVIKFSSPRARSHKKTNKRSLVDFITNLLLRFEIKIKIEIFMNWFIWQTQHSAGTFLRLNYLLPCLVF